MYKVFFNDSSILFSTSPKKSTKDNIQHINNLDGYDSVNQIVSEIEKAKVPMNFTINHQDEQFAWEQFRKSFTEIHAAGGFVRNSDGFFLFIKRFGFWDLPKGKIEKKETAEMAAIREVEEECGLSGLQILKPLDSTFHIYRSPWIKSANNLVLKETKWFLMSYSGKEELVPQTEEDILEASWFPPSELGRLMTQTYASLADLIRKTIPTI